MHKMKQPNTSLDGSVVRTPQEATTRWRLCFKFVAQAKSTHAVFTHRSWWNSLLRRLFLLPRQKTRRPSFVISIRNKCTTTATSLSNIHAAYTRIHTLQHTQQQQQQQHTHGHRTSSSDLAPVFSGHGVEIENCVKSRRIHSQHEEQHRHHNTYRRARQYCAHALTLMRTHKQTHPTGEKKSNTHRRIHTDARL